MTGRRRYVGRHELRARFVKAASPDGTARAPAARAVPLRPGSAGLPAIDPKMRAHRRARLGGPRGGCEDGRHYFVKQGGQWVCSMCGATR